MNNDLIKKNILILKNDATGDLTKSLHAINNIIKNNKDQKIIIYLSERSEKFSFLINNDNVEFKKLNYDLSLLEKIKLFLFILNTNISKVYILAPKIFYFWLPPIFKKIKFYGLCINGISNYKRPGEFLRKYLFKYVINNRAAIFKRDSTEIIQYELTKDINQLSLESKININIELSDALKKYLPKNYIYFHLKKDNFDKLGWGLDDLDLLFNEFLKHYENIIFTRDIEKNTKHSETLNNYNTLDFSNGNFIKKNNNIYLYENITGKNLYNIIKHSNKVVAFHGMMTNLAAIEKKQVIDLWYSKITNWNEYRNNRNAFYEFKPKYADYNFIIPRKNINKTINKMRYAL